MKALGCEVEIFMPSMWLPRALGGLHPGIKRLTGVPREWTQEGVRVHRVRGLMAHPNLLRYRLWPRLPAATAGSVSMVQAASIERLVGVFKPDAVLAHEGALLGRLAATVAGSLGVAWGVIEHDSVDFQAGSAGAKWYARTMSPAAAVFGVAPASVDRLREIGLTNVHLAPDGIIGATDEQRRTARPAEFAGKRLVLTSGSPVAEKGHAELVRAFQEVAPEVPGATLVVVGPVTPTVERLLADPALHGRVKRLERMPASAFQQWMVWADVFVLPSYRESFGMVFGEALAAGTPVLLTDACGIAPLLTHGEHGWIVPVRDHAALVRALKDALTTPDLERMGEAGRHLIGGAGGRFTWENSARCVLNALGLIGAKA